MQIRLLDFGGQAPTRKHYNDAGADVYSPNEYYLQPGQSVTVPLGFGLIIPDGFAGYVFPRSGLSSRGIGAMLPPIDSGYRGEVHAFLVNNSEEPYHIRPGDRIGQLVILPTLIPEFVSDLGEERKDGALGSTGR